MIEISTDLIKSAVYKLCYDANICLDRRVYKKILNSYNNAQNTDMKNVLRSILQNAKIAYEKKLPLCQDTGQVIVFVQIGQNVKLTGDFIEDVINSAVEKCYTENFFRKSIVKNAVFERENTKTNIPAVIYTKYIKEDVIKIKVLIKGAGSENKSQLKMILPTASRDEIISCCSELILKAGENACPPMFIGIGIGGTADKAVLMSKEALISDSFTEKEEKLAGEIKYSVNSKLSDKYENNYVLDVKLKTSSTHIASMPVSVTVNCHSERVSSCYIQDNKIVYEHQTPDFIELTEDYSGLKEIFADDTAKLKELKDGEEFLLTGWIYTARDMAHKKIDELIKTGKELPFDIKGKIIFYAGPCPKKPDGIIGSIGPTTASRMDVYAIDLYNMGLAASIGKGSRNDEVKTAIKSNGAKYFTVTGGIAALLSQKVLKSEVAAFSELGTEAVYKLYVEKFPLRTSIN